VALATRCVAEPRCAPQMPFRSPDSQYFDREDVLMRLTLAEHCSPISVESHCGLLNPGFVASPYEKFITVHSIPDDRLVEFHKNVNDKY
jgi:hypothetical protein